MTSSLFRACLLAAIAALCLLGPVHAQKGGQGGKSLPVDSRHLTVLVKTSVIAVNQANLTNNYTVLRALAAPAFREKNSPKDLENIFARLRQANLDLSPIVIYEPQFTRPPEISPQGFLRLTGFFPTAPLRVNFDLMFQPVGGEWKLIAVSLQPAQATAQPARLR